MPEVCAQTGVIVVVAKCPIPGKSKTRLIPLLGKEGSSKLAKAMLSDVLMTLECCPAFKEVQKVLLYAPGDKQGLNKMEEILQELGLDYSASWKLLPMVSSDLLSSNLGYVLQYALDRIIISKLNKNGGVVFLGMDSPALPLRDILTGLQLATINKGSALLCPADDGGYGMLCIPEAACRLSVFEGVYWSHPLTAVSQLKTLTDRSIAVVLGQLMHDIDEPDDVERLCKRLSEKKSASLERSNEESRVGLSSNCLQQLDSTASVYSAHRECSFTEETLRELGFLKGMK